MQAPPPTGCTGNAPPPAWSPEASPAGDGGAGAALDGALYVLVGGVPAPLRPPTAKASTAALPHAATMWAATLLALRVVMAHEFNFLTRNVQK